MNQTDDNTTPTNINPGTEKAKSTSRNRDNLVEPIKSKSGNYRIFPKIGETTICMERVDDEPVPWQHQQVIESFYEKPGCTFAAKVGEGRLQIDLSRGGVNEQVHVEIVNALKEML